jgi:multidrug efflux system membrane fusion protein
VSVSEKSKSSPWIKILLLLCVGGGGAYWYLHSSDSGKGNKQDRPPIAVASVVRKDVPVYLAGLGTVQAYNTVTVHSQIDGQLTDVLFSEGQEVKKGDVLAKIDPRTYQAQYDQAVATKAKDAATLANARHDLERYANLGNSVSGQTLDTQRSLVEQLNATVKADQAAIDNAKTQLSYTTITSLIDGRTGIRQVDAGNIIHASDANGLVVVTQLKPISVLFSLPQQNLQAINEQIAIQGKLQVIAVGNDGHTLDTGTLELVDNQIDQATGTIKLKSTFPNDKLMLWPGGFTNVKLLLTTRKNAVVVPTVAVQRGPSNSYVFLYKPEDKTVTMRTVKVAMSQDLDSVIDDGLAEGDQVVIDGMAKLQEGSKVTLADDAKKDDTKTPDAAKSTDAKPTDAKPADAKTDDSGQEKKHHHHDSGS